MKSGPPVPSGDAPAPPAGAAPRTPGRCPCCGRLAAAGEEAPGACPRCSGSARSLGDASYALRPARGFWLADLLRGLAGYWRAVGQVMHHRAFVGHLKVPLAANAIAFVLLAAALLLGLLPVFESWFREPWPFFDGLRAELAASGPVRLLLATAGLLWPIWCDVLAGAMLEPLAAATERAVGGPGMAAAGDRRSGLRPAFEHLHFRARLLALQILLLPAVWLLALLPYVGLPVTFLLASAAAAIVWFDTPAVRRGLDLRWHFADLRRNWPRALGFGAGCQLGLAVPFVNLLLLAPAAVVGATEQHFEFEKRPVRP